MRRNVKIQDGGRIWLKTCLLAKQLFLCQKCSSNGPKIHSQCLWWPMLLYLGIFQTNWCESEEISGNFVDKHSPRLVEADLRVENQLWSGDEWILKVDILHKNYLNGSWYHVLRNLKISMTNFYYWHLKMLLCQYFYLKKFSNLTYVFLGKGVLIFGMYDNNFYIHCY